LSYISTPTFDRTLQVLRQPDLKAGKSDSSISVQTIADSSQYNRYANLMCCIKARLKFNAYLPPLESWVHSRLVSCKVLSGQNSTEAGSPTRSFKRFPPGVILAHCFGVLVRLSSPGRPEFSTNIYLLRGAESFLRS